MGAAILFALALSMDGFGVGLSYGLKKIRIPFPSMLMILCCTVVSMGLSVIFGESLMRSFDIVSPNLLAAGILFALGLYNLVRAVIQMVHSDNAKAIPVSTVSSDAPIVKLEFKLLGVIIQVLKAPEEADLDGSGSISVKESALLGMALSLDALASGLALGLAVGIAKSLSAIALVAITQLGMICLGQHLTHKIPEEYLDRLGLVPGALLILLAFNKLF